ncbi:MAG TPA: hypothetical protein VMF52_18800 [Steroidobacteraceae bacterium]|nr:hypothetical protein [Steroidobacteraceae bacterium]
MPALYLYVNAALYLVFAVWCTVAMSRTAPGMGFTALTSGGRSEYLSIYGGLQVGLAIAFWLLARTPAWHKPGLLFSIVLYAPIVLFRLISLARFWPVGTVTLGTAVLEVTLLALALWLYFSR